MASIKHLFDLLIYWTFQLDDIQRIQRQTKRHHLHPLIFLQNLYRQPIFHSIISIALRYLLLFIHVSANDHACFIAKAKGSHLPCEVRRSNLEKGCLLCPLINQLTRSDNDTWINNRERPDLLSEVWTGKPFSRQYGQQFQPLHSK
jgi:hypothetical protein